MDDDGSFAAYVVRRSGSMPTVAQVQDRLIEAGLIDLLDRGGGNRDIRVRDLWWEALVYLLTCLRPVDLDSVIGPVRAQLERQQREGAYHDGSGRPV